jgi:thiamine biosynthesis protein ThiS
MNIQLNGDSATFAGPLTIRDLLQHLQMPAERVAVVVNSTIIRRTEYDHHELSDGDAVDIITMVGGG